MTDKTAENTENLEPDTSLVTARTPVGALPVASLFFTHGGRIGQEIPLTGITFFMGRSGSNNLIFHDKSVSRKHAVINFVDGRYVLTDLDSLKGTYVNGRRIKETELKSGDLINVGENRMQFRMITPKSSGKRGVLWVLLLLLLIAGLGFGGWFYLREYAPGQVPPSVMVEIEMHYEKGVEFFNKERNVAKAREEWKRIIELDPEKKTDFAIKADRLLKDTE